MPQSVEPPDLGAAAAEGRRAGAPVAVAAAAALLAALLAARYPVAPALLVLALAFYAALLWRWPRLWLAVVPAVLPALDFAPWTGWSMVEEPDLAVLVTVSVLALRAPPRRADFALRGWGGAAIAAAIAAAIIGVTRGLAAPALPDGSAIAYFRPDNALRIAKGLAVAVLLLPFLRRALSERSDAATWLTAGMAAGLVLVAAVAVVERALFPGMFDFDRAYRIVATFSSMEFGGGFVGAYAAMALPFALALLGRRRGLSLLGAAAAVGGLYTLAVAFARAALGSGAVGSLVFIAGRIRFARTGGGRSVWLLPLAVLAVALGLLATGLYSSRYMDFRMRRFWPDLALREELWREGLAFRPGGLATAFFGMGLGSYARTAAAALPPDKRSANILVADGYLALTAGQPVYLGQRVTVEPGTAYRLSFKARTALDGTLLKASLCEKVMLYSTHCREIATRPAPTGQWQSFDGTVDSGAIGRTTVLRVLRRPVELSFFLDAPGTAADLADVRLTAPDGRALVANGDFAHGLDHWFLTDDAHTYWRIENQYLMTLFEEGLAGVAAFLFLAAVALARATHAIGRGERMAPAFVAALAAFLASGLFDCPLEVPRLAALFYLIAFAAIGMGEAPDAAPGPVHRRATRASAFPRA